MNRGKTTNRLENYSSFELVEKLTPLLSFIDKKDVLKRIKLKKDIEKEIEHINSKFLSFFKKVGKGRSFFESVDKFSVDTEIIEEYCFLDIARERLSHLAFVLDKDFEMFEKINKYLEQGKTVNETKKYLIPKIQKKHDKEILESDVGQELYITMTEELLETKRKYKDNFYDQEVSTINVMERFYSKHPEWQK